MATATPRKLFLNLPVRDLKKSMDFFAALGFTFNPQFTDENAACMVFSEDGYAMLLQEKFFKTFTHRPVADARQHTEGIFALSCTSRSEVDDLLAKALAAGATTAMPSTTSMGTIGRRCGWIRATSSSEATSGETRRGEWSGRQDSNLRLLAPKASALPG
jgi:predicted lactoylglutathione lyase